MDIDDKSKREITKHVARIIILFGNLGADYSQKKAMQNGDRRAADKYNIAKTVTKELYDNFDDYSGFIEDLFDEYQRRKRRK